MATANDEPGLGHEEPRKLYQEADKLLGLAERLQEKCEEYERRSWSLLAMGVIAAMLIATLAILVSPLPLFSGPFLYALVGLACVFVFALGCGLYLARVELQRQLRRERRALHGIVDMLREVEKGVAERNNLSALERAEFRIRLSRFDIGPGSAQKQG